MTETTTSDELQAERLFSGPEIYLLEFEGLNALLVPMTRESYRRSIFTDRARIVTAGEARWAVDLGQLVARFEALRIPAQPLRYVFHVAHCGSTLFARAFDEIGGCLVYREPYALRQLGVAFAAEIRGPEMRAAWDQLLRLVSGLLARRFDPAQPVIVKANVPVNFVLPQVLDLHPESRGILLHAPLRTFLLNGVKSPDHQRWALYVVQEMAAAIRSIEALAGVDPAALSPAQAASCLWLAQMHLFARALEAHDKLRALDCETFFDRPFETLQAACGFFGLETSEEELLTVVAGKLFTQHAKFPGERYDAATRRADLDAQALALSDQIAEGTAWAEPFLEPLRIPKALPKALL